VFDAMAPERVQPADAPVESSVPELPEYGQVEKLR
jgi:hypothetical protein